MTDKDRLLLQDAFPLSIPENVEVRYGFYKRELGAFMIMQGLCAKYNIKTPQDQDILARLSQELADTLLIHLDNTKPKP